MGDTNLLAVLLGTVAFWVIGAIWYGPLFSKPWIAAVGMSEADMAAMKAKGGGHMAKIMVASFVLEFIVVLVLGHLVAATEPSAHGIMLMAVGLGAAVMAPAIGINYLYQNKPLKLWLIDAGYFVVGMAAAGGVFLLLG